MMPLPCSLGRVLREFGADSLTDHQPTTDPTLFKSASNSRVLRGELGACPFLISSVPPCLFRGSILLPAER